MSFACRLRKTVQLPVRLELDRSFEHFRGPDDRPPRLHQKGVPPVDPLQYGKLHGPTVDGDLLDRFGGADGGEHYVAFGCAPAASPRALRLLSHHVGPTTFGGHAREKRQSVLPSLPARLFACRSRFVRYTGDGNDETSTRRGCVDPARARRVRIRRQPLVGADCPIFADTAAVGSKWTAGLAAGVFDSNVTLAGEVFEIVQGKEVPVEGAWVYCELCTEETHAGMYTDNKGAYAFTGVWAKLFWISVTKPGYQDPRGSTDTGLPDGWLRRDVTIKGNTRFNVELARK